MIQSYAQFSLFRKRSGNSFPTYFIYDFSRAPTVHKIINNHLKRFIGVESAYN